MKYCISLMLLLGLSFTSCNKQEPDDEVNEAFQFVDDANGCSNFIVYRFNEEGTVSLVVSSNKNDYTHYLESKTINLPEAEVLVSINEFNGMAGNFYCDDVSGDEGTIIKTWEAISGNLTVSIDPESVDIQPWMVGYRITVTLSNVTFEAPDGEQTSYELLEFNDVYAGWFPG